MGFTQELMVMFGTRCLCSEIESKLNRVAALDWLVEQFQPRSTQCLKKSMDRMFHSRPYYLFWALKIGGFFIV